MYFSSMLFKQLQPEDKQPEDKQPEDKNLYLGTLLMGVANFVSSVAFLGLIKCKILIFELIGICRKKLMIVGSLALSILTILLSFTTIP